MTDLATRQQDANAATVRHRVPRMLENGLTNIGNLAGTRHTASLRGALKGCPVFLVSAGPSLDRNISQLKEACRKGIVMAVNSAAPALKAAGVRPHIVLTIEAVDLSRHLDLDACDQVVCDLSSSPAAFQKMRASGGMWFHSANAAWSPISQLLGCDGLDYDVSVAAAGASLAGMWGCSELVLVGQDLAFTDGRCYATGCRFDDLRATVDDDHLVIEGSPDREWWLLSLGIPPPPSRRKGYTVPTIDGGEALVPLDMVMQAEFFARFADAWGDTVALTNSTEGGQMLLGWAPEPLEMTLARLPDREIPDMSKGHAITSDEADAVRDELLRQGATADQMAERFWHGKGDVAWADIAKGLPYVDAMVGCEVAKIQSAGLSPADATGATYQAWKMAAWKVRQALGPNPI